MKMTHALEILTDLQLLAEVSLAAETERGATARLIGLLAELDARRLYLAEGCSSLFSYCTRVLNLSEHAAYSRIESARVSRRFPVILDRLQDGSVSLTTISLIAPHLTDDNHRHLLERVHHKSKREVEQIVSELRPRPEVPPSVRKLPSPRPARTKSANLLSHEPPSASHDAVAETAIEMPASVPCRRPIVAPLAPERYRVQFTMSSDAHDNLRRVQELIRHSIPTGDLALIFERALTLLLEDLERTRMGKASVTRRSRGTAPGSRHVPAAVRREVWRRDDGQCAFVGTHGRCTERGFLEIHHVVPFAHGGPTVVDNLQLRCRSHNAYEAELSFDRPVVREVRPPYVCNSVRTESGGSGQRRRNSQNAATSAATIHQTVCC